MKSSLIAWFATPALLIAHLTLAQQSNNHALPAVPPPGVVVIDGQLDDWDLSGEFEVFANYRLRNSYSTRVAAMYDAEFLYLAVQWRDPTPMFNMIDARFDIGSGWRSDCLQLRLRTDMTMHVDCWYSTAAEQPVITVNYGRYGNDKDAEHVKRFFGGGRINLIEKGARQAFRKGEDGASYVQEIALPWALISGQAATVDDTGQPYRPPMAFKPGDSFSMGMEFLWGGPDGKTWPVHRYADLLAEGHTSREFFWTAEKAWGPVKLMPAGNLDLPKPVIAGLEDYLQKTEGPVEIPYTMPFDGFATLVIEDANGIRVRNLFGMAPRQQGEQLDFWDGADDHGVLVEPGTYRWRGLLHAGINPVYEATYGTPGQPPWDSADGAGAWLSDHNPPTAVATGRGVMLLAAENAEAGWGLIGTNPDGRKLWGQRGSHIAENIAALAADDTHAYIGIGGTWNNNRPGIGRLELKTGRYAPFPTAGEPQLIVEALKPGETGTLKGLTVAGDRLAAALAGPDVVRFFAKTNGAMLDEIPLPEPRGLATDQQGNIWALSGTRIVRLAGETFVPAGGDGLVDPHSLAIDAQGQLYVSDQAAHQVKVFAADGKPLPAIGIEGGRPKPGIWRPDGMRRPAGLAIDAEDRLWVMEQDMYPKRISVWSPAGALLKDFIGPTTYGGMGGFADAKDKTRVFGSGCEWRLDYETGEAKVLYNCLTQVAEAGDLRQFAGREYFMSRRQRLYRRDGDAFRLIAMFGRVAEPTVEAVRDHDRRDAGRHNFLWTDLDNDGDIQAEEIVYANHAVLWSTDYWGGYWLDDDFNIAIGGGSYSRRQALRVPRVGLTEAGVPIYNVDAIQVYQDVPVEHYGSRPGANPGQHYFATAETIVFGTHPIIAARADGTVLWTYPNRWGHVHGSHHAPMPADDATLIGTLACIGIAESSTPLGRIWAANSNMGRLYLMTTDGLLVASVFQDNRVAPDPWPEKAVRGTPIGGVTMGSEWFGGYFFRSEPTNEYYLIAGGTAYNLIRLDGFDSLRPLAGATLAFTGDQLVEAQALRQRRAAADVRERALTIARLATAPAIDGQLDSYPADAFVEWSAGPHRARALVATDGTDLFLAWEVFGDNNPMVNAGQDPAHLFVTGDSVDLQLGTDADANPQRPGAVPGDLRLLVSVLDGQPVAVLYRWQAPAVDAEPHTFRSPWRETTVADVRVLANARLHIARHGNRYIVEAAVPLATLGFQPQAGRDYRLDLGVIYSNAEGNNRAARVYWANPATGLTADIPGEIMPTPNLWGTARLPPDR